MSSRSTRKNRVAVKGLGRGRLCSSESVGVRRRRSASVSRSNATAGRRIRTSRPETETPRRDESSRGGERARKKDFVHRLGPLKTGRCSELSGTRNRGARSRNRGAQTARAIRAQIRRYPLLAGFRRKQLETGRRDRFSRPGRTAESFLDTAARRKDEFEQNARLRKRAICATQFRRPESAGILRGRNFLPDNCRTVCFLGTSVGFPRQTRAGILGALNSGHRCIGTVLNHTPLDRDTRLGTRRKMQCHRKTRTTETEDETAPTEYQPHPEAGLR